VSACTLGAFACSGWSFDPQVETVMPGFDFNGDGRDDILWEEANSLRYSNWLGTGNGGFLIHDADALDNWAIGNIVAVGDFNGDGRDDTLWRSGNAIYLSWTGVGGTFIFMDFAGFVANVSIDWHIVGAGDFDGDGKDDILWKNDDGRISNWLSNGDYSFEINDANAMTTHIPGSLVRGIGDFNGDGRDDFVNGWTVGNVTNYDLALGMQSGAFGFEDPFTGFGVPSEWQIAGVGDFNGDGRDDLFWRHENGTISNWLYAGGLGLSTFHINDSVAMRYVSTDWQVVAIGDYNGDGRDDILWRNSTTGHLSNWLGQQNGGWLINDTHALVAVPLNWVVGPHEFGSGAGLWDY
jgi:hypothetical protein